MIGKCKSKVFTIFLFMSNTLILSIDFWQILPFIPPCKHQKTKAFLVFPGGIKWEHWTEIVNMEITFVFVPLNIMLNKLPQCLRSVFTFSQVHSHSKKKCMVCNSEKLYGVTYEFYKYLRSSTLQQYLTTFGS